MKIYFVAHSDISSSNRFKQNNAGIYNYPEFNAGRRLAQMIDRDVQEIFLVSSPRKDISQKSGDIINAINGYRPGFKFFNTDDERIEFNGEFILGATRLKPNKAVPKILANLGVGIFDNFTKADKQAKNLFEIIGAMLDYEKDNRNIAFVISASSDVYKFMQSNKSVRKLCYFGDEKINVLGNISKSKQRISEGDVKMIEVALPKEIGYDGEIETIAARRIKEKNQAAENQKI